MSDSIPEMFMASGAKLPVLKCVICGYEADCATCVDEEGARPSPGDWTLCLKCGEILIFEEGGKTKVPTIADFISLSQRNPDIEAQLVKAQQVIRKPRPVGL